MTTTKKTPPIVQIGAWLLSLIVFIVGFWHTHLGLKEMRPFGSEYGSIAIAGIILLLLLISYWFAVNGKKMALIFYIICGLFFFVFNLNYFYPAYMARQLVKEEAIALNDTLQKFTSKSQNLLSTKSAIKGDEADLGLLKDQLVSEIKNEAGFGPRATRILNDINTITGSKIDPSLSVGKTQEERDKKADDISKLVDNAITAFYVKNGNFSGGENTSLVVEGYQNLISIQQKYTDTLKRIIEDDHEIQLDSLIYLRQKGSNHPQIQTLQNLVTDLDNATKKINEGSKKNIYPILKEAETRNLGRIKHTLNSVKKRFTETDTLGIILVCLFIDLLVPLAIYFLLKKDENEGEDKRLTGPKRPIQF